MSHSNSAAEQSHGTIRRTSARGSPSRIPYAGYLIAVGVLVGITPVLFLLKVMVGYRSLGLVYLLTIVVMALFIERGPTLFAAIFSLIAWDFFFLPPTPAIGIEDVDDALLASTYLVVAIVLGHLTNRTREQERARREGEEIATALYLITREIAHTSDFPQLLKAVPARMESILKIPVGILLADNSGFLKTAAGSAFHSEFAESIRTLARWCVENKTPSGRFTARGADSNFLFLPLLREDACCGVLALELGSHDELSKARREMFDAFASQISLAFERQHFREESEKNRLVVESEKLGKALLDSMSHEIRTPLAAIQAATGSLLDAGDSSLTPAQIRLLDEIREASERLNRLAGNVMDITRVESGRLSPRLAPCDISDLVHVSIKEVRKEISRHHIHTQMKPGLPLMLIDFVLVQQALTNLISNAARHTPPGTDIFISAAVEGNELLITVADNGPGIPADSLPRLFDKFYRCPGAKTGGTGLGLSLVKGFIEAHRGRVTAQNRPQGGSLFTICLPIGSQMVVSMD